MVSVIIPAAGRGTRMKAGINKSFLELSGKPMLIRSIMKFSDIDEVGEVIVAVAPDEVAFIRWSLEKIPGIKPTKVVEGGDERQMSVANALKVVSSDADVVLVHDAARPLVTKKIIEDVIEAARANGAAIAAVRAKNTVKKVDDDGTVRETPDRSELWEVQTPQGFTRGLIMEAYLHAMQDGFIGTDDAALVERIGRPVKVVEGSYSNIKVTSPEDIIIAEALIRNEAIGKAKEGLTNIMETLASKAQELRQKIEEDMKTI
ncbi:MAG: 2-C-methyl-D-erythritol 4-phosphate cytidylyltransferase [Schwartzia sp.]|nr:2-C-methyl-D-erythritol 4-phosphate cytidylyltransferase [Schwartzia sp. (in: firmicutes)]